jgi:hypothetical protein
MAAAAARDEFADMAAAAAAVGHAALLAENKMLAAKTGGSSMLPADFGLTSIVPMRFREPMPRANLFDVVQLMYQLCLSPSCFRWQVDWPSWSGLTILPTATHVTVTLNMFIELRYTSIKTVIAVFREFCTRREPRTVQFRFPTTTEKLYARRGRRVAGGVKAFLHDMLVGMGLDKPFHIGTSQTKAVMDATPTRATTLLDVCMSRAAAVSWADLTAIASKNIAGFAGLDVENSTVDIQVRKKTGDMFVDVLDMRTRAEAIVRQQLRKFDLPLTSTDVVEGDPATLRECALAIAKLVPSTAGTKVNAYMQIKFAGITTDRDTEVDLIESPVVQRVARQAGVTVRQFLDAVAR